LPTAWRFEWLFFTFWQAAHIPEKPQIWDADKYYIKKADNK